LYILDRAVKFPADLLLCLVLGGSFLLAQENASPTEEGYVTRVKSSADFDVNGFRVVCGSETLLGHVPGSGTFVEVRGCPKDLPFVGEPMKVSGKRNKKLKIIEAAQIEIEPIAGVEISGSAVIDSTPVAASSNQHKGELLVRADGYQILISSETHVEWTTATGSLAAIHAGDWIKYRGKMDAQGIVMASSVTVEPDVVSKREQKFRGDYDFDPSSGFPSPKPDRLKEWYGNTDLSHIPIFLRSPMQARIDEIGNKLIPAYQRALAESDPAKLHFHFQLVDEPWRGCMVLPGGVIFVPVEAVERMQNDSQTAALLAAAVADVLERQEYRSSRFGVPGGIEVGAGIADAYFPGMGLYGAGFAAAKIAERDINARLANQRGRVSLSLMHDAGYDIDQAPLAWWLLSTKKREPLDKTGLPKYSEYLYSVLGEVWHNPSAGARKTP
jgi:hypothetical protein